MILELNTRFADYFPCEIIGESTPYREAYHAINNECKEVTLVVYDMAALPECYENGEINEIKIVPLLTNDIFPRFLEHGDIHDGTGRYKWITTEFIDGESLASYLSSGRTFSEKESLEMIHDLIVGVKEVSWNLDGGAHNNISCDNIIISTGDNGEKRWHLAGLECASRQCRGRAKFDSSIPSYLYRAPETGVGSYGESSDIFAIGILMSLLLQGFHPWKRHLNDDSIRSFSSIASVIKNNEPELAMKPELKSIVGKAIEAKLSDRYKRFEELDAAIVEYLGNEKLNEFECFIQNSKTVRTPAPDENRMKADVESNDYQTPPQPKSSVSIEHISGNGFKDVAGMTELKNKLTRNFIDIVKNRELASAFKIEPPNGIIFAGPPGVGKSFISRKLGEECGMMYSLIQPSDLGNIYIHGSQSMIADLFIRSEELARKNNCGVLLVFDEFDSLVPKRDQEGDNKQANEVAEFLTRLNNCAEKNIFVIGTTNRIDAIDPAILRKGRMDEIIYIDLPDEEARKDLLIMEIEKRPHDEIDYDYLARLTKGYTAGDISFIVKESARCAFERSLKESRVVNIDQTLIEATIAATRASVTAEELKKYEKTRDNFIKGSTEEPRRIGFQRTKIETAK